MAWSSVWDFAKWIFDWISPGGRGSAIHSAYLTRMGMARDVLGGRRSCTPRALHSLQSKGIGSVETAPCSNCRCDLGHHARALEDFFLPRGSDDHDDVLISWHAGF